MPQRLVAAVVATALALPLLAAPAGAASPKLSRSDTAIKVASAEAAAKSVSGKMAKTDRKLLGVKGSKIISVLVKLDYDGSASYAGGIGRLAATSPSSTGKKLDRRAAATRAYEAYQTRIDRAAQAQIARIPNAKVIKSHHVAYGGLTVRLPADRVSDLLAAPGVVAVQADSERQLLTDRSPAFIGATTPWAELGGPTFGGKDLLFVSLDTGVWPEHPAFADLGTNGPPPLPPFAGSRPCNFGDDPLTPATDPFVCQNKLIAGAPFLDTYNFFNPTSGEQYPTSARDGNGHGTHTSSTAAGNQLATAVLLGVDRGPVSGIAPGAYVEVLKVCGKSASGGCYTSDSVNAVEQAIVDGGDVINFSISGGNDPATDPVELAFLDATAAGIFVAASAGNSGPSAGTVAHNSPWVTTVAASTEDRQFASTLTVTGDGATFTADGASVTAGEGPLALVLSSAAPYSDDLCLAPAASGIFTGKIVACKRGGNARVDKGYNVKQGGAKGMVLYNTTSTAQGEVSDNHWLPTVHIDGAEGDGLLAFVAAHATPMAQFTAGVAAPGPGDVMADFSSRGPSAMFLKPDITAPGVQILAGNTPTPEGITEGPPGQYFQAIAGTSMSSPHIAGSALLIRSLHRDWSPGQIKSAIMTTARTRVFKEDGVTPADPFDMGSGRVNLDHAGHPGVTFSDTPGHMAALFNDPLLASSINLPSVDIATLPGRVTVTRRAANASGHDELYRVQIDQPTNGRINASPGMFLVEANSSRTLQITINSTAAAGSQGFGRINLVPVRRSGAPRPGRILHLPVAYTTGDGAVSLTQDCDMTTVVIGATAVCTIVAQNTTGTDAYVDATTTVGDAFKIDAAHGAKRLGPRKVTAGKNLTGKHAGNPTVNLAGSSPAGFLPLPETFGSTPFSLPNNDESIINLSVPEFMYAGDPYTTIGVTTDGYLVVGGGTGADVKCCPPDAPQTLPDPARPNNVLAPFWTDLEVNPAAPGGDDGIYAEILCGGAGGAPPCWVAVEVREHVFGDPSQQEIFQAWLGINGTEDISFAYPKSGSGFPVPTAPPPANGLTIGAENNDGTGGDMVPLSSMPADGDFTIESTPGLPGGKLSYTVNLKALTPGPAILKTNLNASTVLGTTTRRTHLDATAP